MQHKSSGGDPTTFTINGFMKLMKNMTIMLALPQFYKKGEIVDDKRSTRVK